MNLNTAEHRQLCLDKSLFQSATSLKKEVGVTGVDHINSQSPLPL